MKRRNLLNAYAVLAWIQNEEGAQLIEDLLLGAEQNQTELFLNIINLGEVYYRLAKLRGNPFAQKTVDEITLLPLKVIPASDDLVFVAARIKAQFPLSYADCFAVATALKCDAALVSGDPEFQKVKNMVELVWV